ncbi:cytochrome P450 [Crocosphaera subtropica ATCC 51142]|uniref:Cytochrome P450 n=1 Tax=Crocosphaera subtropica (strain ATCC 51142 / BH68) TaxID=43989 RepID=B1X1P6_CROS5|nr:cytochrome P450 [Crocosphaera subtropica]ACB53076.1 cytochrome P450 [Crocosphaera subtropica ATCC 51142]
MKAPSHPLPPGRFGLPIVGETLQFLLDPNFADKREKQYGSIYKTQILGRKTVFMSGSKANQFILSSHMDHFSWGKGWPNNFQELLGRSLFVQDGQEHQRNRKLLMPAFHGQALAKYLTTMEQIISQYLSKWEKQKYLTWFPEMKKMTFEIASVLLLGTSPGENIEVLSQWFAELTNGLFAIFPLRTGWSKYGKALAARDRLLEYIDQQIEERISNPGDDALGLMIQTRDENEGHLSKEEIKVQALLLLFAGHETTTSMLVSFCMALAQHRDILEKAKAEQKALNIDRDLTPEKLKQMTYLEQILKEVERLYPPVGGGFRGVVKPFVFNGYYVPEHWIVSYRINASHQDRNVFPNPEKFDPDRFSRQREEHKKTEYSLVGFGGGPRFCLGYGFAQMEMKIFASLLLRHYFWEILPDQNLTLDAIPTLHPRSGLKVKLVSSLN